MEKITTNYQTIDKHQKGKTPGRTTNNSPENKNSPKNNNTNAVAGLKTQNFQNSTTATVVLNGAETF